MAVSNLDEDEKGVSSTYTPGGFQDLIVISESGLYTLIIRSRKATTPGTVQHRFRRWVTSEVLPTIRKTGSYGAQKSARRQPDPMVARNRSTAMAINSVTHALGEIRRTRGIKVASKAAGELYKKIGIDLGDDLPEQPELGLDPLAAE